MYDETQPAPDSIGEAVNNAQYAVQDDKAKADADKQERAAVKRAAKEYKQAREFDKDRRSRFALDRRYAAGTADVTWAVDTNLVGSYIDILVSFLYARDPDVSARKAPQVSNSGSKDMDTFARTCELVVSRLWKDAKLKKRIRKQVRSALTTGPGWIKAVMYCDGPNLPQMITDLNDQRAILQALEAQKQKIAENAEASPEDIDADLARQQELIEAAQQRIEAVIRKFLAVDFCPSETVQVSVDVADISDYLEANWVSNHIYVLKDDILEKFPRLQKDDLSKCTIYYQRGKVDLQPITDKVMLADGLGGIKAEDAEQFTAGEANSGSDGGERGPAFLKVIERWNKTTNHVETWIEGCERWAKDPYEPDYPTSRFYPYFYLGFYEVDGERYPQSLSHRLHKLQDEYARARSNWRITRERSIPAVLFNASQVDDDNAKKVQGATYQELIGITLTDPAEPITNAFAPKPVAAVDGRVFDTGPIVADMEKISGVQEALQASAASAKTATEAQIQQTGFASRTTADRDNLEDMLTDLAQYTVELALTALNRKDVMRIAGPSAFWPQGMSIDDILTLVEISITAGTTGKPKDPTDRQAWGVILPTIKEAIVELHGALMSGNRDLAVAIHALIAETMRRFDDNSDPDTFLPPIPDVLPSPPPPQPPPPKVSISLKGDLPPAAIPGLVAPAEPMPPAPPDASPSGPGGAPPLPGPEAPGGAPGGLPLPDVSGTNGPNLPPSINS